MHIPQYPAFSEISFDMKAEIEESFCNLSEGLSEFFFGNLYFFRNFYSYKISRASSCLIISGTYENTNFCMVPSGKIPKEMLLELLEKFGSLSFISESLLLENSETFNSSAFTIIEDRNNFDYLYLRSDLANLSGKKFHKKKNHVNRFVHSYSDIKIESLTFENCTDAIKVLEKWKLQSYDLTALNKSLSPSTATTVAEEAALTTSETSDSQESDYFAALEALKSLKDFNLTGIVVYVNNVPVAWTLGEISKDGKMAIVYFEKADIDFQGAFQYVNYAFANFLPESVVYINREQDLGKPGLIHSKQTYNPIGFVKKYSLKRSE